MKLKNYILASAALVIGFSSYAQSGRQKKADNLFNKFAFVDATNVYHDLIDKNYNTDFAVRQLADSYAYMRNPDSAVVYYKKAVAQNNVPVEYYYNYAQALRGVKDYKESRIWMQRFKEAGGELDKSKFQKDSDFINSIFNSKQQYFLTKVNINSRYSDFGAFEHDGLVYFASSRDEGVLSKHKYGWNEEPFLDIYVADKNSNDSIAVTYKAKLKGDVNSLFHEGPITISKDGKTMYFSRTSFIKNSLGRNNEGVSTLKIYKASLIEEEWTNIEELPFNNDEFSLAHPALNENGTKLYFASDMPGSIGGSDIFYVDINANGTYSKPQNAGNIINTDKNERFPFVNSEGTLFFSSDGHQGLGLLDIFAVVKDKNKNIVNVLNLGVPVNSSKDDFSFFMNADGLSGYFSSNRDGGHGSDDIYAFDRVPQLKLEGVVYDNTTNTPIPNATITLLDNHGQNVAFVETDENGVYQLNIDRDTDYKISVKKDSYLDDTKAISSKGVDRSVSSITSDFSMSLLPPLAVPITELSTIYFNFDSANIRDEDMEVLDEIADLMIDTYTKMNIKIEAFSDSRGPRAYNEVLSQKRANSAHDYLISKGVDASRIIEYKGYGEQNLVNECNGSVKCNEDEHQLNRRTDFKPVALE